MVVSGGDHVRFIGAVLMARRTVTDRWFVSVEMPRSSRGARRSTRQTKSFPKEAEAKRYAKAMVAEGNKIMAGTLLSADQPVRRIILGSELYRWIEEGD
jgi:hypothetical protein